MVIPPPNVTGSLHLGHALMVSIEVRGASQIPGSWRRVVRGLITCLAYFSQARML